MPLHRVQVQCAALRTDAPLSQQRARREHTESIVGDDELFRQAMANVLEEQDDLTVIGQATSVARALATAPTLRPDIAVLDTRLPDGNGVDLCRQLRSMVPDLNCLMLTEVVDEGTITDAILAGAGGCVIKDIRGSELTVAVRTVGSGISLLDNRVAAALIGQLRARVENPGAATGLTEQERRVRDLIDEGLSDREIGRRMFRPDHTVPDVVTRSTFALYRDSGARTDFRQFPDRGHSLTIDSGWREIADAALTWIDEQTEATSWT